VLENGANVDFTVHLNSPNFFVSTGAGSNQAFLFNATGVVLSDITVDAHTPALAATTGTYSSGGAGTFSFGIACGTCGNGAGDRFNTDIVFHIANATIADVTAPNNLGNTLRSGARYLGTGRDWTDFAVLPAPPDHRQGVRL
jgi:hypothetical protein